MVEVTFHQTDDRIAVVVDGNLVTGNECNRVVEVLNSEPIQRVVSRLMANESLDVNETIQAGKECYDSYANFTGFKSLATGQELPQWEALPEKIRQAWNIAAAWVVGRVLRQHGLM